MTEIEAAEGDQDAIFLDPDLSEDISPDSGEDALPLEEVPAEGSASPNPDELDEGANEEEEGGEEGNGPIRKKPAGTWMKRLLFVPAALALVLLGAFLKTELSLPGGTTKEADLLHRQREIKLPLIDEKLSPFFVPLSADSSNVAVRLDVLVRWDRLTSARFKKDESKIRTRIYQRLLRFAQSGKKFDDKSDVLEQEISRTIKKRLGASGIELVIDGVKFI